MKPIEQKINAEKSTIASKLQNLLKQRTVMTSNQIIAKVKNSTIKKITYSY
jgi:predicted transcriptional regulator